MLKKTLLPLLFLMGSGCTVEETSTSAGSGDIPKGGEALKTYSLPALCRKRSECDPRFAVSYPEGVNQCVEKNLAVFSAAVLEADWTCTRARMASCVSNYATAVCPTVAQIKAGNAVPAAPDGACSVCGF